MKKIFVLLLLAFSFVNCDDEVVSRIPWAEVYLEFDLLGQDRDLNGFAAKIFTERQLAKERYGYGGILVFNNGGNEDNFFAYDLSCPVEVQTNIRVKPNDFGEAICEKCGAVYLLYSKGVPVSGEYALRQYNVSHKYSSTYIVTH